MTWDWNYTGEILPDLLDGLRVTVLATVLGYLIALVLGLVWTLLRRTPSRAVNQAVRWVVEFIRSTPLLVQLFFIFYVLPSWGLTLGALTAGVIGLGLHYSTYTCEVYRAGIADVPRGQWEACVALNLPRRRAWQDVILPQAVRRVVPSLGNYLIAMFKDSPLLLAISVSELLGAAYRAGAETLRYLEPITVVGVLFVIVSVLSSIVVRRLERRYATY
ncbi:ectoine/hydroxyectoine ABC transporter permease subunit EhuD [Actinomadura sp. NBRC 104425]|uniref:ectoine/hydroxyectoine ABC transporter permease subunit EhuD n=1 Tax=Actinomadura sp. NBRC 104425 TaxID=3032204 RepID=UPI0024A32E0A|nr:ectoine/hydroxyectoine ABC transporter permease subunit EhuD [Actinomadura sp. NBRC 104425]GLZ10709.1 ectoine/hydroxyectoine ABC transporter permease subunit EhuD [Actinomadura sp. NBRC 104425]